MPAMNKGFPFFFRLLALTFFRRKDNYARITFKRLWLLTSLFVIEVAHRIALALDNVFFPGYKRIEIKEPVFMVGIPRSGTTFLHQLLANDSGFVTFKYWEIIFAPSILERKFWTFLAKIDRVIGRPGYKILLKLDAAAFDTLREIHQTGLWEPEEDNFVLMPIWQTYAVLLLFPFPDLLLHFTRFDDDTPPDQQDYVMRFYRACVQRHLYFHGKDKRFLSKNPAFSAKIDALRRYFPDARVICNVRRPYEAVPSLMSLHALDWRLFHNRFDPERFRDMNLVIADYWYRHPLERLPRWPEDRYAVVRYDDLTASPKRTVEDLYRRFGFAMSPEFAQVLEHHEARQRQYASRHGYSLEDFLLTPELIHDRFKFVFDRYGFDPNFTPETPASATQSSAATT